MISNPTGQPVTGTLWFYGSTGALVTEVAVTISAKGIFVLNTATIPALQGIGGTAMFSSDAPFGVLAGKTVAVEPATGFTFDTAMVPRGGPTRTVPRDN